MKNEKLGCALRYGRKQHFQFSIFNFQFKMSTISLNNMMFYSHHGCFEAERVVGTRFCVHLSFDVDTVKAEHSDDIADTVSYFDVYQIVKTEMQIPSNLLEHVARRIIDAIQQHVPKVSNICVSVEKLNPPLGGEIGSASVKITN
jgi:dihydroneopterin aldolase